MEAYNIDQMIETLQNGKPLTEPELIFLMDRLKDLLLQESNVLKLQAPIIICGDIHGQLYDLLSLFNKATQTEADQTFLFMGDYVDRGCYSIETFALLAAKKIKNPNKIFLLRGNHESRQMNVFYGFYEECKQMYGNPGIYNVYNEVFDFLPLAARVQNHFFAVHGGISPSIKLTEQIDVMNRRIDLPMEGPMCDLCWSDPELLINDWKANLRGAGYLFGESQCDKFLYLNDLKLITRSHQVAPKGYEQMFNDKLITVWSAPHYCGRNGIRATFMQVDADCNYHLIEFLHRGNSFKREFTSNLLYFA